MPQSYVNLNDVRILLREYVRKNSEVGEFIEDLVNLGRITLGAETGTPPLVVSSTSLVANLNVDMLDGYHASDFVRTADTISGIVNEAIDDEVALLLQNTPAVTWDYNDDLGTITPSFDHGGLVGLGADSHTQYARVDGGRNFTENQTFNKNITVTQKAIVTSLQMVTGASTGYVLTSDATGNASWSAGVVTNHGGLTGLSADDHVQYARTDGTREITGSQTFQSDINVTGQATVGGFRLATGASAGYTLTCDANGVGSWAPAVSDHGGLGGLADDDHPQYVAGDGRVGGQTVNGGIESAESLTLRSTGHLTKGNINIGSSAVVDEQNNTFTVVSPLYVSRLIIPSGAVENYLLAGDSSGEVHWVSPSGMTIGNDLLGGTINSVLYEDANHKLAESPSLTFDGSTFITSVGHTNDNKATIYGNNFNGSYSLGLGLGTWGLVGAVSSDTSENKIGVYGWAAGNSGIKYAVYGQASGAGTNYAGYFNGDVKVAEDLFVTGSGVVSGNLRSANLLTQNIEFTGTLNGITTDEVGMLDGVTSNIQTQINDVLSGPIEVESLTISPEMGFNGVPLVVGVPPVPEAPAAPAAAYTPSMTVDGDKVFGEYMQFGYTHTIRIYAYNGSSVKSFSPTYATATFTDPAAYDGTYYLTWTWDAVPGATGYRVYKQDDVVPRDFDFYQDVATNSLSDGDIGYGSTDPDWVAGTEDEISEGFGTVIEARGNVVASGVVQASSIKITTGAANEALLVSNSQGEASWTTTVPTRIVDTRATHHFINDVYVNPNWEDFIGYGDPTQDRYINIEGHGHTGSSGTASCHAGIKMYGNFGESVDAAYIRYQTRGSNYATPVYYYLEMFAPDGAPLRLHANSNSITTTGDFSASTLSAGTTTTNYLTVPSGALNGYVLTTDDDGHASWTAPAAIGAIAVGNPISLGVAGRVLFEGTGNVLAESANLSLSSETLTVNNRVVTSYVESTGPASSLILRASGLAGDDGWGGFVYTPAANIEIGGVHLADGGFGLSGGDIVITAGNPPPLGAYGKVIIRECFGDGWTNLLTTTGESDRVYLGNFTNASDEHNYQTGWGVDVNATHTNVRGTLLIQPSGHGYGPNDALPGCDIIGKATLGIFGAPYAPYNAAADHVAFFSKSNMGTSYDFVVNKDTGYTGFNKRYPAYQVDVNGTIGCSGLVVLTPGASGYILTDNGSGRGSWTAPSAIGAIAIGNSITGGTPSEVLYVDTDGELGQDSYFKFTPDGEAGLLEVPSLWVHNNGHVYAQLGGGSELGLGEASFIVAAGNNYRAAVTLSHNSYNWVMQTTQPSGISIGNGITTPFSISQSNQVTLSGLTLPNGASDGRVLTSNATGVATWEALPAGGITIGDAITGGVANGILHGDSSQNLSSDGRLTFDQDTGILTVGGIYGVFENELKGEVSLHAPSGPTDTYFNLSGSNGSGMHVRGKHYANYPLTEPGGLILSPDGGTNYVKLTTDGFGFNTVYPHAPLDIVGSGIVRGQFYPQGITMTAGAGAGKVLTSNAAGIASWAAAPAGMEVGGTVVGGSGNSVLYVNPSGHLSQNSSLRFDGNKLVIGDGTNDLLGSRPAGLSLYSPVGADHLPSSDYGYITFGYTGEEEGMEGWEKSSITTGLIGRLAAITTGPAEYQRPARGLAIMGSASAAIFPRIGYSDSSFTNIPSDPYIEVQGNRIVLNGSSQGWPGGSIQFGMDNSVEAFVSTSGLTVLNNLYLPQGASDGYVLTSNAGGTAAWEAPAGASLAIGSSITAGTAGRVLFEGAGDTLMDDSELVYNSGTNTLYVPIVSATGTNDIYLVTPDNATGAGDVIIKAGDATEKKAPGSSVTIACGDPGEMGDIGKILFKEGTTDLASLEYSTGFTGGLLKTSVISAQDGNNLFIMTDPESAGTYLRMGGWSDGTNASGGYVLASGLVSGGIWGDELPPISVIGSSFSGGGGPTRGGPVKILGGAAGLGGGGSAKSGGVLIRSGCSPEGTNSVSDDVVIDIGSASTLGKIRFKSAGVEKASIDNTGFYLSGSGTISGDIMADDFYVGMGGLNINERTNSTMGTVTLSSGTSAVVTTAVTANSRIFLTGQNSSGTHGELTVSARNPGSDFTITSSSAGDTRLVAWMIVEPY